MRSIGYYDGEAGYLDEMKVPMEDRGCYFGDGVYDATLTRRGIAFALDEHIARFMRSAEALRIDIGKSAEELHEILSGMAGRTDEDAMLYFQVTRGAAERGHAFPEGARAKLWIMLSSMSARDLSEDATARTEEDIRYYMCNVKTLNLIPNVLASQRAKEAGCYETIFHRAGRVTECAHSNVHIIKDGTLITAPTDNLILPGIARAHLLAECGRIGVPVVERAYTLEELFAADEVLITSSASFCLRVKTVDGRSVGGRAGAIVKRLQENLTREFIMATGG